MPSLNSIVARVVDVLAASLMLVVIGPGGWEATKWLNDAGHLQLPSLTLTGLGLLGLGISILPKLVIEGWTAHEKTWHTCRLIVSWSLFILLYPFNLWERWGVRLNPLWASLSVFAIYGASQVIDLRRDRPLVEGEIAEMAKFLNELPRMEIPASQPGSRTVSSLLDHYKPLARSAEDLYPDLRDFTQALQDLYLAEGDFGAKALVVMAHLEKGSEKRAQHGSRVDAFLTDLLLVRLYIYKFQASQGMQMDPIYKAWILEKRLDRTRWPRSAKGSIGQAYSTLDDLRTNSTAVLDLYCADRYDECTHWSKIYKLAILQREELLDDAERRWEDTTTANEASDLSRARAINNRAELVMERLQPEINILLAPTKLISQNNVTSLINLEDRLLEQRIILDGLLRVNAQSNVMATLARVDLLLAQINGLIYDYSAIRGNLPPEDRIENVSKYLRWTAEDISMAVRSGFDSSKFQPNPHSLNLCMLLAFNLQSTGFSAKVREIFAEAQVGAIKILKQNGVEFSCPICRKNHDAQGIPPVHVS